MAGSTLALAAVLIALVASSSLGTVADGKLVLPQFLASHMVFQRKNADGVTHAQVRGKSSCDSVQVSLGKPSDAEWVGAFSTRAGVHGDSGEWVAEFPAQDAGTGFAVTISACDGHIVLLDVAFGDVLLCSGQSNMEFNVLSSFSGEAAAESAHLYDIRMFTAGRNASTAPTFDIPTKAPAPWLKSVQASFSEAGFSYPSAVCYYTAREMHQYLGGKVPIGIVGTYWGGQKIERFMTPDAMADTTCGGLDGVGAGGADADVVRPFQEQQRLELAQLLDSGVKLELEEEEARLIGQGAELGAWTPGDIWNAMVGPLVGMKFTTALWYQGEANAGDSDNIVHYACRFPAMIADWRAKFRQPDLPFFYVQLAGFKQAGFVGLRASQAQALRLPRTGEALAIDTGNFGNVHPKNKTEVGRRLALNVIWTAYGDRRSLEGVAGPTLSGVARSGADGLTVRYVAGTGGDFFFNATSNCGACCHENPFQLQLRSGATVRMAKATFASDGSVALVAPAGALNNTTDPAVAVTYNWEPFPQCSLYGRLGGRAGLLPAVPFKHALKSSTPGVELEVAEEMRALLK